MKTSTVYPRITATARHLGDSRPVGGALCRPASPQSDHALDWQRACVRAAELFAAPSQLRKGAP